MARPTGGFGDEEDHYGVGKRWWHDWFTMMCHLMYWPLARETEGILHARLVYTPCLPMSGIFNIVPCRSTQKA